MGKSHFLAPVLAAGVAIWCHAASPDPLTIRTRTTIPVGKQPDTIVLTVDGSRLFVGLSGDQSVSVVETAKGRVTGRIPLGCGPGAMGAVPDGSAIVAVCDTGHTGVHLIALPSGSVKSIPRGRIRSVVITRDAKTAYLAEYAAGVGRLDLSTHGVLQVHPAPLATDLALTPDGNVLYVNYQHWGPGGRDGHDAIGKFDSRTGRFLGAITGLANVGNTLAVSPDGRTLWANGDDACISRRYDHLGCPAVPAGVINIIDTATDRLVRSLPLLARIPHGITFSWDGSLVALSGQDPCFLDARTFAILAQMHDMHTNALVFSRDGRRAYATLPERDAVAVLDIIRR